jgi:hypothetical protein
VKLSKVATIILHITLLRAWDMVMLIITIPWYGQLSWRFLGRVGNLLIPEGCRIVHALEATSEGMNIARDLKLKVEIAMVEIHLSSQTHIQISPNNIHFNIGFYKINGTLYEDTSLQQFVVEVVNCVLVCFELFHVFHVACELL